MISSEKAEQSTGIVFTKVSKSFDGIPVLKDLSLTVKPLGVTALMGQSGSGKTTICSLLLGIEKPDAGRIDNPYKRISCAFQDPRLIPWLTAEENVSFVLTGLSQKEKRDKAREILMSLGLGNAFGKLPRELSGGMQQRVSLARAFIAPHELLILDEPFRGLDEGNKGRVIGLIRKEAERCPVLLVTHDVSDIEALNAETVSLD